MIVHTTTRYTRFVHGLVHVIVPLGADAGHVREITAQDQRHYSLAQPGVLRIWTSLFEDLSTKRHGACLHMRHDNSSKIVPTATHAYMRSCTRTCTTSTKRHGNCLGCSGKHMIQFSQDSSIPRTHAYMPTCTCARTKRHGNCLLL